MTSPKAMAERLADEFENFANIELRSDDPRGSEWHDYKDLNDEEREFVALALRSFASAQDARVSVEASPADTVLVPREPTEEMLTSVYGMDGVENGSTENLKSIWQAMIAAAPAHPLVTRQEIERETIERCAKVADDHAGQPVQNPQDFNDWAKHGERMSALRIGNKIRSLSEGMGSKDDVQKSRER